MCTKNLVSIGISLFCFYFHLLFFLAILFSDLSYMLKTAQSSNILLKLKLLIINRDIIHIINLNCTYTSWRAIATYIITQGDIELVI